MSIEVKAEPGKTGSPEPRGFWDDVKAYINGTSVRKDEPFLLPIGQRNRLTLVGEGLNGEEVSINNASGEKLVFADPDFAVWQTGANNIVEWHLTQSAPKRGKQHFVLISKGDLTVLELHPRLMDVDLTNEVDVLLVNGNPYRDGVVLYRGTSYTFTVRYKPGSVGEDFRLELYTELLTGLKDGDVTVTPDPNQVNKWTVENKGSGTLRFGLTGVGVTGDVKSSVGKAISTRLEDEVNLFLNGKPLEENGADILAGHPRTLTLGYNDPDLMSDFPLAVDIVPVSGVVRDDFKSTPPLRQLVVEHEWRIETPVEEGQFKIKVSGASDLTQLSSTIIRLLPAYFRFHYLTGNPIPFPPYVYPAFVNVLFAAAVVLKTSDNAPIAGAAVTFEVQEKETLTADTDDGGVARYPGHVIYSTPGIRKFKATVTLPQIGVLEVEALANFVAPASTGVE